METNEQHKPTMQEKILGRIHAHELSMHPRYYFMLRVAALAAVALGILIISVFIFNFLLFSIRISSQDTFLSFGPRGWGAFFLFFPWDLFAADVVLVALLLWLLRQFKFGYKSPALYVLLGLVLITALAGFVVDRTTGLNEHFLSEAGKHHLPPPFNDFYNRARRPAPPGEGVCRCTIVAISGNTLTVSSLEATATPFTVTLPLDDPRATTSGLEPGDTVFIAGQQQQDTLQAFGVHKIFIEEMK